jgi:hypothetical protein
MSQNLAAGQLCVCPKRRSRTQRVRSRKVPCGPGPGRARVAPANAVLATWQPGPIPPDFAAIRDRWETGHMAVAALKLLGFMATALAVVASGRRPDQP